MPQAELVPSLALLLLGAAAPCLAHADPLPVIMTQDPGLPTHTLYRPADLTAAPGRWPVVLWANGECLNLGNRFRGFLTPIAAEGYVVIAVGPIGSPQVEVKRELTTAEGGRGADHKSQSNWTQLIEALDWAQAADANRVGAYYGRLDLKHVAVMGQSCGGLQALRAAEDPRITTVMLWNSGTMAAGTAPLEGTGASKQSLARLHGSIAIVSGDDADVAAKNSDADYAALPVIPALRAVARGVGHDGSFLEPGGGVFTPVAIAWLNWQLKADARAARMFTGADCGLCRDERWRIRSQALH